MAYRESCRTFRWCREGVAKPRVDGGETFNLGSRRKVSGIGARTNITSRHHTMKARSAA